MYRNLKKSAALTCVFALLATGLIWPPAAFADSAAQTLPFAQNWTNIALLNTTDDWSTIPGIIGYRGDGLTGSTGTDPQTILGEGTPVVDVNVNQTNPNTFATGGATEFHITDPVVALAGSGTARAPYLLFHLNTTGLTAINVAYNLRDIDGSTDNSIQPIALQYRVGGTGNFTNIPSAFVADASGGPSQATLVTPVSAALPPGADNQALVQVRVMTTDAVGNDEWIGIDDINVTGTPIGGPTNPTGLGAATPNTVGAGGNTLLTVAVTNGTNPTSTGVTVTGDLSAIGGSATQQFFDNGTNGDVTGGDNVFSYGATVAPATTAGLKSLPAVINDAEARTGNANISLTVTSSSTPPSGVGTATPNSVAAGANSLLTVAVTGGTNPPSTGLTVTGNLSTIGGSTTQTFLDNGTNGDTTAGDNTFSYLATVAPATAPGAKSLPVTISDAETRSGNTNIALTVTAAPPTGQPLPFSQNWTDINQITTNNVWGGVPGIIGIWETTRRIQISASIRRPCSAIFQIRR